MAIIRACLVKDIIKNTGKECDAAMGASAQFFAVPQTFEFDDSDLEDPVTWMRTAIHADKGARVYPLFGQKAPIRTITNNQEADSLVVMDDGSQFFLRYGFYNRTFETTSGGLCYAESLQSLNKCGYNLIEIDKQGQMLVHNNKDGTYTGLLTDFMYSPAPVLPDFKTTPYKNRFMTSFDPQEMVSNGLVMSGAKALLSLMGLIDAEITLGAAATDNTLTIGVRTVCAKSDLVALIGANLGSHSNNFIVKDTTGAVISGIVATIVSGKIVLTKTGAFATAGTYTVSGAAPSVWLGNNVFGFDAEESTLEIVVS